MPKITVDTDCGNSPKKQFLKQFNIAFAEGDVSAIAECVTDDITWYIVNDKTIRGKSDFVDELERMKSYKTSELLIKSIITHGNEGEANGELTMQDGKKYAFCDVYKFKSAKGSQIQSITSYNIELTQK